MQICTASSPVLSTIDRKLAETLARKVVCKDSRSYRKPWASISCLETYLAPTASTTSKSKISLSWSGLALLEDVNASYFAWNVGSWNIIMNQCTDEKYDLRSRSETSFGGKSIPATSKIERDDLGCVDGEPPGSADVELSNSGLAAKSSRI